VWLVWWLIGLLDVDMVLVLGIAFVDVPPGPVCARDEVCWSNCVVLGHASCLMSPVKQQEIPPQ
jgi:hypothetical protein